MLPPERPRTRLKSLVIYLPSTAASSGPASSGRAPGGARSSARRTMARRRQQGPGPRRPLRPRAASRRTGPTAARRRSRHVHSRRRRRRRRRAFEEGRRRGEKEAGRLVARSRVAEGAEAAAPSAGHRRGASAAADAAGPAPARGNEGAGPAGAPGVARRRRGRPGGDEAPRAASDDSEFDPRVAARRERERVAARVAAAPGDGEGATAGTRASSPQGRRRAVAAKKRPAAMTRKKRRRRREEGAAAPERGAGQGAGRLRQVAAPEPLPADDARLPGPGTGKYVVLDEIDQIRSWPGRLFRFGKARTLETVAAVKKKAAEAQEAKKALQQAATHLRCTASSRASSAARCQRPGGHAAEVDEARVSVGMVYEPSRRESEIKAVREAADEKAAKRRQDDASSSARPDGRGRQAGLGRLQEAQEEGGARPRHLPDAPGRRGPDGQGPVHDNVRGTRAPAAAEPARRPQGPGPQRPAPLEGPALLGGGARPVRPRVHRHRRSIPRRARIGVRRSRRRASKPHLVPGMAVRFRVRARNQGGWGDLSGPSEYIMLIAHRRRRRRHDQGRPQGPPLRPPVHAEELYYPRPRSSAPGSPRPSRRSSAASSAPASRRTARRRPRGHADLRPRLRDAGQGCLVLAGALPPASPATPRRSPRTSSPPPRASLANRSTALGPLHPTCPSPTTTTTTTTPSPSSRSKKRRRPAVARGQHGWSPRSSLSMSPGGAVGKPSANLGAVEAGNRCGVAEGARCMLKRSLAASTTAVSLLVGPCSG